MAIGKALIAKVLGGLAVIGAGGISYKEFNDHNYTRYDWGLIEYLNAGGNIKFVVKSGDSDLDSSTFPAFSTSEPKTATVSIKVSIKTNASNEDTDGKLTDKTNAPEGSKGKTDYLQSLNGGGSGTGTEWTWICELKFTKEPSDESVNDLNQTEKDALIKNSSEGLFNKLKDENGGDENLKIKFIKNCASERGGAMSLFGKGWKNRKINKLTNLDQKDGLITTANELKSEKTFVLVSNKQSDAKLTFKSTSDFSTWFE